MLQIIIVSAVILFLWVTYRTLRRKKQVEEPVPETTDIPGLLELHVPFYRTLPGDQKERFSRRVQAFINTVPVTGIGVDITDLDKILVGASAIIPIHHFPDWEYRNINEVLLYSGTFNKAYQTEGEERNVLGMVGDGAMNGQMILSLPALRAGFSRLDSHNTAIHEFVHLLDKADGSVDGIPEYLLDKPNIIPWVKSMHHEIEKIRAGRTDIDPYGATNDAEFFAVVSEYFFEQPDKLEEKHPELYRLLHQMFAGQE